MSETMQALFIANTGFHYVSYYPDGTFFACSTDYSTHGHESGRWKTEEGKLFYARDDVRKWNLDQQESQEAYERYLARLVVE